MALAVLESPCSCLHTFTDQSYHGSIIQALCTLCPILRQLSSNTFRLHQPIWREGMVGYLRCAKVMSRLTDWMYLHRQ